MTETTVDVVTWLADAHYSVRRLWVHRGYALLAALTLALGVGGTASTYRVAHEC